ncbi:hypothetical protein KI387_002896, partial [Taxus chinensis]
SSNVFSLNKSKSISTTNPKASHNAISFTSEGEEIVNKIIKALAENDVLEIGPVIRLPHVVEILIRLQKCPKLALKFFNCIETQLKLKPDLQSFCIAIHILTKARMPSYAQELLQQALHAGFGPTQLIFDSLVTTYKDCNSTPFVFDLLFKTLVQSGLVGSAVEIFRSMKTIGFMPAIETCNSLLSALLKENRRETLWVIYAEMLRSNIISNNYTFNIMINALCKEGKLKKAKEFLKDMESMGCQPTVVSYNTVIHGFCKKGKVDEGLKLLSVMSGKDICPDVFSYSSIIKGLCKDGRVQEAIGYLSEMTEKGLMPNNVIYNTLIDNYCNKGDMKKDF